MEKKIRSSTIYAEWVERNCALSCLKCNETENLQVHHIPDLYHILLSLWKLYGNEETTIEHCVTIHANDRCDSVTLCKKCHQSIHPGRQVPQPVKIHVDIWTTLPRNLSINLYHGTKNKPQNALGLIPFQTLFGFGWFILNGKIKDRLVKFHRRRFAELLGKTPCSSFNQSLDSALFDLKTVLVLEDYHRTDNNIVALINHPYLKSLENPWFFPLNFIHTNRMSVLTLKWFLSFQSGKRRYQIGLGKLAGHLGIKTIRPAWIEKVVTESCNQIPWTSVTISKKIATFSFRKRAAVPIHTLRAILRDSISIGK